MSHWIPEHHHLAIPERLAGLRLDQALAELLPHLSRNRLQGWIRDGLVLVDSSPWRSKDRLCGNELIEILGVLEAQTPYQPQPIPLDITYHDDDLLVINKPAGLVVHPAAGNPDGTLQNGLLHWDQDLLKLPRCGIVHRLDKDTSGLLVVARSLRAHVSLVNQLQSHSMHREYMAVIAGLPVSGGMIDLPVGRHPTQRTRMAVSTRGKNAITHFQVQERFRAHSLLKIRLATGRTHQIRVHLAHLKFPILGDQVYGGRVQLPPKISPALIDRILGFRRQALHARCLRLIHPVKGTVMEWEAPLPADIEGLIYELRVDVADK